MASEQAFPHGGTLASEIVEIDFEMTAGASGAVPSSFTIGRGVKSVTVNSTDYDFVFEEGWAAILAPTINVIQATPATTTPAYGEMNKRNAAASGGSTCSITPRRPDSGAAALLAEGDILQVTFRMQRNNVDA